MLRIHEVKHVGWDGKVALRYYELFMDSASDLPDSVDYFSTPEDPCKIDMGSLAYDINSSDMYMTDSSGAWILQE